ncbi:MAG: class I SAM-dependent methyltransferase [Anaerolineales bacterium]|nr:class I SAM-dependent methyltransferase [Anaerolineales bacterium]
MSSAGGLLPVLYRSDLNGGWNVGMRAITGSLLVRSGALSGCVLEVGCGAGAFAAELQRDAAGIQVFAVDVQREAVDIAQRLDAGLWLAQADVQRLPVAAERFMAAIALDVLDQIGVEPVLALTELHRVLAHGARLFIRVSAYPWLEGPHDVAFNTARRYGRHEIVALLGQHGFEIERTTYANGLLGLPVMLVRLLQRWGVMDLAPGLYGATLTNPALRVALGLEARWLQRRNLPAGLSLYVVARRR